MKLSARRGPVGSRALWAAGVGQILALLVFVALVTIITRLLPSALSGGALLAAGVILAIVPALIWLAFFYQQDRLEPEPKTYVIEVFALGALLAGAISIPVLRDFFRINDWIYTDRLAHLLGSILVVGFTQEFLTYAAVRFSIYQSAEFDERVDGIIYATAAGLGFATMLNFNYVVSHGGVDLGVGVIRVAVTALAHGSIAGVLGYFLGQAKFEHTPAYYVPAGVAFAAVLNGVFFWAQDIVTVQGIALTPFYGLVLAVSIALVLLGLVFWLIRRANAETLLLAGGK
jgi:RsiW-degrading membrane proteinase PrsW (M82 family)